MITGLLRHKLGFSGLVLTDSLSVPSITAAGYGLPEAAVAALRAGADEVLFNAVAGEVASDNAAIVAAILHAVARAQALRGAPDRGRRASARQQRPLVVACVRPVIVGPGLVSDGASQETSSADTSREGR